MKAFLLVLACLLTGCATTRTVTVPVNVPVSVPCKATVPDKPVMPTEALDPKDPQFLFKFVRAATAEIELRIGYEARLLAELKSCL